MNTTTFGPNSTKQRYGVSTRRLPGATVGRSRSIERTWAIGMCLGGLLATTVIGPIVLSRVLKLGGDASRIPEVAALAGAVTLTVIGTSRLVRSARTVLHRLLALPLAFILIQ